MQLTRAPIVWTPKKKKMAWVLGPLCILLWVPYVIYVGSYGVVNGAPPPRATVALGFFGTFGIIWLVIWYLRRFKFDSGREGDDRIPSTDAGETTPVGPRMLAEQNSRTAIVFLGLFLGMLTVIYFFAFYPNWYMLRHGGQAPPQGANLAGYVAATLYAPFVFWLISWYWRGDDGSV